MHYIIEKKEVSGTKHQHKQTISVELVKIIHSVISLTV